MTNQRHSGHAGKRFTIFKWVMPALAIVIAGGIVAVSLLHVQQPFKSAEVAFTDSSSHGMQIVPASCPSYPYDAEAPYGCSGSTPLCEDGVTPAPSGNLSYCTCAEGNSSNCMSCSIHASANPSPYSSAGTPVTLTWSASSNSSGVFINNIGFTGSSGSTQVASHVTTDYSCTPYINSVGYGPTDNYSVTVTPPPSATASINAGLTELLPNQSTSISATFAAGSGDTLTADNIDSPPGTGLGPNSSPGPKSITFSSATPGTYTFYARAQTGYYPSWASYGQVTVTVGAGPQCTINLNPTTITGSQSSTLSYSSSNATYFCITGVGCLTPNTANSLPVSPSQTTTYTGTVATTTQNPVYGSPVTITLTSSGSSWQVPPDWNNANNFIQAIGGGGGGARGAAGGGGGYSSMWNISPTIGSYISYSVGSGGAGAVVSGSPGGGTWFASIATLYALGGSGGTDSSTIGGVGGYYGSEEGYKKTSGGQGGGVSVSGACGVVGAYSGGGGGGAGGADGNGNNGGTAVGGAGYLSGIWNGANGGAADVGFGGSGGLANGGTGGTGGQGGGGGGGAGGFADYSSNGGAGPGGTGGQWGGGGGAGGQECGPYQSGSGGAGGHGVILITYTPVTYTTSTTTNSCAATLTVACQQAWSCSGNTIVQTNTDCSTTNLASCVAPSFCQSGSSSCVYPPITASLQIVPDIIQTGGTVRITWNASNAQSCTVTGTNGDSFSGLTSSATSGPITTQTTYTLACTAYSGGTNVTQTKTISIVPLYREQ